MHVHSQHKRAFQIQEEEFGFDLLITILIPFCENSLCLLVIMTELTEFERGIIIGVWLFEHFE